VRIDLRGRRRGRAGAFADEAGENAAGCTAVDRDQGRLDGIMKMT
jgi:hypothetical protein